MLTYTDAREAFYIANGWCLEFTGGAPGEYALARSLRREAWVVYQSLTPRG